MQDFFRSMCEKIFYREDLNFDENSIQNFDALIKKTIQRVKNEKKFNDILKMNKNINEKNTILIEQFNNHIKFFTTANMQKALQFFVISNSIFDLARFFEKAIIDFIFKMKAMIMSMGLQIGKSQNNEVVVVVAEIDSIEIGNDSAFNVKTNNFCNYCEIIDESHNRRDYCSKFKKRIDRENIHLNERNLICLKNDKVDFALFIRFVSSVNQKKVVKKTMMFAEKLIEMKINSMRLDVDLNSNYFSKKELNLKIITYEHVDVHVNAIKLKNKKKETIK